MDPFLHLPCWGSASSHTCYLQLPDSFPRKVAGEEAAPVRALIPRGHAGELQGHTAMDDVILDEFGSILKPSHLLLVELLLLLIQVHHVGGLASEPEDLHVFGVQIHRQVACELYLFPNNRQDGFPRASHLDLL